MAVKNFARILQRIKYKLSFTRSMEWNPFRWFAKRKGMKAMNELIPQLEQLIKKEQAENAKIVELLEELKNTPTLESKIQKYIQIKAEMQKQIELESAIKALEENLKTALGKHLKEMQEQL